MTETESRPRASSAEPPLLARELGRLLRESRCSNVRVLDVTGLSPVCDYLVLGTGTSGRQMRSVADDALELAEARGAPVLRSHGTSENWIAIDLFDIVVHLFDHESRVFYDLDGLWGDALELELDPNAATDRSESHRSESHRS